jgi:hypothetical protein
LIIKMVRISFVVAILGTGMLALGQNLGVNPTFAAGAFPGWTSSGSTGSGYLGGSADLQETLAANPSDRYTVSFLLADSQGGTPNYYSANFGATSMTQDNFGASFGWGGYDLTPVAGDGLNGLTLNLRNGSGFWFLDDMVLHDPSSAQTPEPGTIILFASGLLSLVGVGRRTFRL